MNKVMLYVYDMILLIYINKSNITIVVYKKKNISTKILYSKYYKYKRY